MTILTYSNNDNVSADVIWSIYRDIKTIYDTDANTVWHKTYFAIYLKLREKCNEQIAEHIKSEVYMARET